MTWINRTFPNVIQLGWSSDLGWGTAIYQTLYMTFVSAIIGGLLGLIFGFGLVLFAEDGILANKPIYWILDKIVSVFRAIPFIILLAFIMPFTNFLVHTTIGVNAALVPLSLGVFPFYARQVQNALVSVDDGIIEAAQSFGATTFEIIFKVYFRESLADLIRVSTVTLISLVGLTAMAGAIGSGGLGNIAISVGYSRFEADITFVATLLIVIFIFIIQFVGDFLAKVSSHK
ncbi:ABC transporter permease [Weissella fabalis]|uniref:ABC transporter permease n=2 Tax=Periweissella fabalis TaxID=1070421 RepID=A0A7X6S4B1_9LACO|nr:methionine ABC transporter permease [Periweissella fabalis]MCM0598268.1 ABC transporter permease [Periweissella fabalis]NKZ24797.1 ABC transporter permease [Periweissella fabalis]